MRHGLMRWDREELPASRLESRTAQVREAMRAGGFDALIVYSNTVRPAAVTYLTAFTPYWSDALLLLRGQGEPLFATSLSRRVTSWIRSTNPLSEIVSTPKPGAVVGDRLRGDKSVHRVGILEYDMLPFGVFDDLITAAPALELADATELFASVRSRIDADEATLAAKADRLACDALASDRAGIQQAGELLGAIERQIRDGGAEEVYLAAAPDLLTDTVFLRNPGPRFLAGYFAVSVSVAVKGSWVRRSRCFARNPEALPMVAACEAWWRQTMERIQANTGIGEQLGAAMAGLTGATLRSWTVEGCRGSYPLELVGSSAQPADFVALPGSMVVLTLALNTGSMPWTISAPFIVDDDGWHLLTQDGGDSCSLDEAIGG